MAEKRSRSDALASPLSKLGRQLTGAFIDLAVRSRIASYQHLGMDIDAWLSRHYFSIGMPKVFGWTVQVLT
jgi:hypothetical protein